MDYIEELKVDLTVPSKRQKLIDECEILEYFTLSQILESVEINDLLVKIGETKVKEYLVGENYQVFQDRDDLLEDVNEDEVHELMKSHGIEAKPAPICEIDISRGEELRRHLCDLIGCGYHHLSVEEITAQVKERIKW